MNSVAEAVEDMQKSVDGEYGDYWAEASLLVEHYDKPIAAVQTVHRAPWADTPDCPWINELFTDPCHRRRGLARALLTRCMLVVAETGQDYIALRVNEDNAPARALYETLGFSRPTKAGAVEMPPNGRDQPSTTYAGQA